MSFGDSSFFLSSSASKLSPLCKRRCEGCRWSALERAQSKSTKKKLKKKIRKERDRHPLPPPATSPPPAPFLPPVVGLLVELPGSSRERKGRVCGWGNRGPTVFSSTGQRSPPWGHACRRGEPRTSVLLLLNLSFVARGHPQACMHMRMLPSAPTACCIMPQLG
ncbi:hypothetical protein B0J12DRAFT_214553 [Macrophomina phaseolina]|uniref:Uncharacterized protein n=1 Tax=Macrophomina phaseolina TaxID=35725 RepID=A0ABQ8G4A0_9PEZI|nr:hypothetical protein B0J12DRAFT_214553 [Macrophomina phaseolina]